MRASLDFKKFVFSLEAREPIILPSYKGSTLRGGFGNAFRRVVCALRRDDCVSCLLKEKCVYSYVFETPPPSNAKIMRKYRFAPHPFVIEPPPERKRAYRPGEDIIFGLTLMGRALDYLPYFVYTFDELGRIGIGSGRGRYDLREVATDGVSIYNIRDKTLKSFARSALLINMSLDNENLSVCLPAGRLTLRFLTPTRIVFDEHLTPDLEFHILVRNFLRRLALLYYFHGEGDFSDWDFRGVIAKAKGIKVKGSELKWYELRRYSTRQDRKVQMGGLVGEITFEGPIGPFLPLIRAGEILHVGKGTTFGLGKYEIVSA